jgi:hypothetical protein
MLISCHGPSKALGVQVRHRDRVPGDTLAAGWGCGQAYLWSSRDLVVLPGARGADPRVVTVDEDLLLVFRIEAGWVLVCETSVRAVTGRDEESAWSSAR